MLLGNGDGTFTQGPVTGSSGVGIFFTVGDFNGDGIPDIAVTGGFGLGCPDPDSATVTAVLKMAVFAMNLVMEVMAMDLPISTVPD